MQTNVEQRHTPYKFNVREKVWLQAKQIKIHQQSAKLGCNGHYNCKPDLGDGELWWNTWDLAGLSILDAKVLDRNVTWLTKHKDTS